MKISFVRGAYLNNFEGQNYDLPITGFSSLFPIDDQVPFPLVKLPSLADLQKMPFLTKATKYIMNRTLGDSQILFGLEDKIKNSDIVHVGDPHYYYSYQAAQMRKRSSVKYLISTWWETIPFNNESTGAKKRIKKYTMSHVDVFICYTDQAKKCLIAEGVSQKKIKVIPLGVNLSRFAPAQKKSNGIFTILFVGRLVEEKGILDVYEAFKKIRFAGNLVNMRIVGSGPLESTLRANIKKDEFEDCITIEKKSYQDMPSLFQQADILCVPSKKTKTWEEQLGMVFIEAMASGLPIVTYDTGSIREVVQNAGFIVTENDIQGLVSSLLRIIEVKDLREKIGTIGRERAEKLFDAKKAKNKIYELYKALGSE